MKTFKYTDENNSAISVTEKTVDGETSMTVPVHPGNRHYREILQAGITVAPYVAPPAPPPEPDYDAELYDAISKATTIAGLKQALLGGLDSSKARVSAKAKGQT